MLLTGLFFTLLLLARGRALETAVTVTSTRGLFSALADEFVSIVYLHDSLMIDASAWPPEPLVLDRSVVISATPLRLQSSILVALDFADAASLFSVAPNRTLTLRGLELRGYLNPVGSVVRFLHQSPGAWLTVEDCVQVRLAALPYNDAVVNLRATARPVGCTGSAGDPASGAAQSGLASAAEPAKVGECGGEPTVSVAGPFVYLTTRLADPVTVDTGIYLTHYSSQVPVDRTLASQGLLLGGYTSTDVRSLYFAENVVDPACLKKRPGSECVALLLAQLREQSSSGASTADEPPQENKAVLVGAVVGASVAAALAAAAVVVVVVRLRRRRLQAPGGSRRKSEGEGVTPSSSNDEESGSAGAGADSSSAGKAEAAAVAAETPGALQAPNWGVGYGCSPAAIGAPSLSARLPTGQSLNPVPEEACMGVGLGAREATDRKTDAGAASSVAAATYLRYSPDGGDDDTNAFLSTLPVALESSAPCEQDPSPRAGPGQGPKGRELPDMMAELGQLSCELRATVGDVAIQLESMIGSGSFGTVYKGTWQGLSVAVKTVVFSANADNRRRALQEAALCKSINHPNVIATYASDLQPIGELTGVSAGSNTTQPADGGALEMARGVGALLDWRLYIIQEYADLGPLRGLYGNRAIWPRPGIVHLPAVVGIALAIARALAHLHSKRIVHGDLNPNNVLLKRDAREASGFAVKVGDFGLSVLIPEHRSHLSNMRVGTMFYVCPAVAMHGRMGPVADVFSLGVILWELFWGVCAGMRTEGGPRYRPDFPDFPPGCPTAYRMTALACLQRQPEHRPTAADVEGTLTSFSQALGGVPQVPQTNVQPLGAVSVILEHVEPWDASQGGSEMILL
ncbi:hypothetical protein HYH03_008558 [Edaphochlamys debaryana]|uniref:Protein kinase domain-containing protein n=1 Tax=Edaphochlamys debaryana TaxID=47281 RepID=A0A835Y1V7_9CHLO|nr:hypothetical protein HYH03_008558 [Edaphochlamys debaryana]|eukprot:KAG2493133.1 hypothetical protein HYH03_008558 [Edaphochlamys debaryana]